MANPHWVHTDHLLVVSGAPSPLVTLAECKDHLEIEHTDKDTFITALALAASQMIDGYDGLVGKAVAEQTVKYSIQTPPSDHIHLPIFPVKSLTSVSYYDSAGNVQAIDVNNFRLIGNEDYAWLEAVEGFTWPTVFDRHDAITFTLLCGFSEVPQVIKHAALMLVAHWFENREAAAEKSVKAIDFAVDALVGRYRKGWIGA